MTRRKSKRWQWVPAATAMLVAALTTSCADKTSLLINVTSDDLVVPTDLDVLEIQVVGDESGQMATARYELSRPFPHSISVRPGRSTSEEMTVTVTAGMLGTGGGADRFVARRVARSRFVDGETVVLTLELTRRCVGVMCATGIDCVEGICTAPSTDGGVPEAGPDVRDMAQDTGPVDAGPDVRDMGNDLGPPACRELDCDDGDSCTSDSCDDTGAVPVCVSTTRDLDGDGHGTTLCPEVGGVPADDCDDGDDTLAPGLPEACNGRDDDCDEECDEDFECCRGESRGCATSCGSTGQRACNDACALGECIPPEEQCNGTDDDCDGPCDEDFECCLGLATECVTTCGSRGSQECVDGCVLADCVPPDETCNGVDDDCDGDSDEGFPCEAGTSVSCTTTCASTGSRTCDASCALGACVPPPESCGNSVDDDCNGMIDEGCMSMCNQSCGGATAVTGTGGRFVQTLVGGTNNGSCGGTGGVETVFTFTTTTVSDVFITTHGSPGIDTVVYVRACRCAGPERACNDDADGLVTSALRLPDLAAGTYNVFVDSRSTTPVAATVDIYITPTGADGDRCGRVLPLTIPAATGNNCGLTSDVNGSCEWPESLNGPDRVYYLTVPPGPARMVTFDTSTGCTDYDTSIDLRRSCAGTGMLGSLGCDDDGVRSSCSPTDFQSRLSLSLEPGVYYLNVDGYGTSCGNYTLTTTGL